MVEITFEDVEIALKILREFQRKAREVNRVLKRFGIGRSSYRVPRSMEDFMNLVMQTYYPKLQKVKEEEEKEEELTEESVVVEEVADSQEETNEIVVTNITLLKDTKLEGPLQISGFKNQDEPILAEILEDLQSQIINLNSRVNNLQKKLNKLGEV